MSEKICNKCKKLTKNITIKSDICRNCITKIRKKEEPFFLEDIRRQARNYYRKKNGIPLDQPLNENQSEKRKKTYVSTINQAINFLLENGYEVKISNSICDKESFPL